MSGKLNFLTAGAVILLGLVFLTVWGCQMPAGAGSSRNLVGEDGQQPALTDWTPGSLSVEMDQERGVAVYVNDKGERFDVSAEEYPGGPLIACVEVESFAEVPPSNDPEALAVKAIVGGVRSDGELGAWAIYLDDSINLTVGEDGEARCLGGSSSGSIMDGMQARFGWRYKILGSASDTEGRTMVIVGRARNPGGFLYGSVEVLPESPVAVYWRVWRLPYSRFRIITPPRVIGTYAAAPAPEAAAEIEPHFAEILARLRQFFHGRLESYLVKLDPENPISWDDQARVFVVRGTDQDWQKAIASIDRSGNVTIEPCEPTPPPPPELPDLALSDLLVKATRGGTTVDSPLWGTDQLTITAEVANTGAKAGTGELKIDISPVETVETELATRNEKAITFEVGANDSTSITFGPYSVETLVGAPEGTDGEPVSYQLVATLYVDDKVKGSEQRPLYVGTPKLVLQSLEPVTITTGDSVDATVENQGTAPSREATLEIGISDQEDFSSFPIAGLEPGKQRSFSFTPTVEPGTWELYAALDGQVVATAELTIEPLPPKVYDRIVIQTYPVLMSDGSWWSEAGFMAAVLTDKPSWDPATDPATAALAYSAGFTNTNGVYYFYNQLVYAPEGGIPGGTKLYVCLWAPSEINSGRYAVRLLLDPSEEALKYYYTPLDPDAPNPNTPDPNAPNWIYTDDSTTDASSDVSYEADDAGDDSITAKLTLGGELDAQLVPDDQRIDRYMAEGDTDWVIIDLPEN